MKDGSTHLAHKAEHGVDMDSGAILSVTLRHADLGDTTTIYQTVAQASENLEKIVNAVPCAAETFKPYVQEVVTDKGYHSKKVACVLEDAENELYFSQAMDAISLRRCAGVRSRASSKLVGMWKILGRAPTAAFASRPARCLTKCCFSRVFTYPALVRNVGLGSVVYASVNWKAS